MPRNPDLINIVTALRPATLATITQVTRNQGTPLSRSAMIRHVCESYVEGLGVDEPSAEEIERVLNIKIDTRQKLEIVPPKSEELKRFDEIAANATTVAGGSVDKWLEDNDDE